MQNPFPGPGLGAGGGGAAVAGLSGIRRLFVSAAGHTLVESGTGVRSDLEECRIVV
jgi:hypothetical protein